MPKPILCLSEQLSQYLEAFRGCFSKRQWKYFVIVLLGLVECEERRTMTGLLRGVGERICLSGLSRFLSKWLWSTDEVAQTWQQLFRLKMVSLVQAEHQRLRMVKAKAQGRPKKTVVTGYLIFDDSVHVKPKGRKMDGLGKHYSNTEGHVVAGHCMFSGLYVILGQNCPLQIQMYRPRDICELGSIPFLSKVDMAVNEIEQFEPVQNTHTHLIVDIWYHCKQVRRAAQKRSWDVSGGLKCNRTMRLFAEDGSREWIKLSQYAAKLSPNDWHEVTWPSEKGGQKCYAHVVRTHIRKLGPTLLLITCHHPDEPNKSVRYWGSTVLDLDAQELVNILAIRWNIETFFEYEKDLLGSDQYQLMSANAILRFWTLTACLYYFLEQQRACVDRNTFTCGDARRMLQYDHRLNLLKWLESHFKSGMTSEQIHLQLAI